jgi:hypothetical protein
MAKPGAEVVALEAQLGERMIEVKVRFWTNDIAKGGKGITILLSFKIHGSNEIMGERLTGINLNRTGGILFGVIKAAISNSDLGKTGKGVMKDLGGKTAKLQRPVQFILRLYRCTCRVQGDTIIVVRKRVIRTERDLRGQHLKELRTPFFTLLTLLGVPEVLNQDIGSKNFYTGPFNGRSNLIMNRPLKPDVRTTAPETDGWM